MRIRTIKPEFFTHEGLFDAEKSTGLPLRVGYAGLWCAADKSGRFKWEPRRLGVAILPYDGIDFSRVLDACLTRGFLVKYRVKDAWFGAIPSWVKHQFINNRETPSTIPDVSEAEELDASITRDPRDDDAFHKERKGKGKEEEGNGKPPKAPLSKKDDRPTTPNAIFVAELFSRPIEKAWTDKEIRSFKKCGASAFGGGDLKLLQSYYAHERARGDEGKHRRDIYTFLNNAQTELDRARLFADNPEIPLNHKPVRVVV